MPQKRRHAGAPYSACRHGYESVRGMRRWGGILSHRQRSDDFSAEAQVAESSGLPGHGAAVPDQRQIRVGHMVCVVAAVMPLSILLKMAREIARPGRGGEPPSVGATPVESANQLLSVRAGN